jgi:hypothetical protein
MTTMRIRRSLGTTIALAATLVVAGASGAHASGGSTTGGADLQISGSASTGSPNAGSSYSYSFGVKNSGPLSADATFSTALPAGAGFKSGTVNGVPGCTAVDSNISCSLGTIAAGSQAAVVLNAYAPTAVGSYSLLASVASSTTDPNTGNNSVSITVQVKTPSLDTINVTKAYTNATPDSGGEMLIKASSSDTTARLFAYRPDGVLIGEVQNGGGSRYGGTVMPWQFVYSPSITIVSSSGGTVTVPTTPFQI